MNATPHHLAKGSGKNAVKRPLGQLTAHFILLLAAIPFLLVHVAAYFYTDGQTARFVDPFSNSLWLLHESGLGNFLPLVWKILFLASIAVVMTTADSVLVLATGLALLIVGTVSSYSLLFALPIVWTFAAIGLINKVTSSSRIFCLGIFSFVGAACLGPLHTLAMLGALLPVFGATIVIPEAILLLLPSVCTTLFTRNPFHDSYPAGAQLVARNGVPWIGRPFFGTDFPFTVINRASLTDIYGTSIILFGLITLLGYVFYKEKKYFRTALGIALILALEVFFGPPIADIAPISVLQRLVPGLWTISLVPYFLFVCVICAMRSVAARKPLLAIGVGVCFVAIALGNDSAIFKTITYPDQSILVSPSANVIRNEGVINWDKIQSLQLKRINAKRISLLSDQSTDSSLLTDRNIQTRLQLSNRGKSTFCLAFDDVKNIEGVVLSTGDYAPDFPRGIQVTSVPDCQAQSSGTVLFSQNPWQGKLMVSEQGYPYFGNQSDVRILFEGTQQVKALRFEQTGYDTTYDWSVAEFMVLQEPR